MNDMASRDQLMSVQIKSDKVVVIYLLSQYDILTFIFLLRFRNETLCVKIGRFKLNEDQLVSNTFQGFGSCHLNVFPPFKKVITFILINII